MDDDRNPDLEREGVYTRYLNSTWPRYRAADHHHPDLPDAPDLDDGEGA